VHARAHTQYAGVTCRATANRAAPSVSPSLIFVHTWCASSYPHARTYDVTRRWRCQPLDAGKAISVIPKPYTLHPNPKPYILYPEPQTPKPEA